ncbi:MAG: hypothetical protein VCC04_09780, partial [Myxococcota bacterium]
MKIPGSAGWRIGLILACCCGSFQPGPAQAAALLPDRLEDAVPLETEERAAAMALGQADSALNRGDPGAAAVWLEKAEALTLLADHLAFQRARLLAARGRHAEAASLAASLASRFPESPLAAEIFALRAEALAAGGHEAEAREAWEQALATSSDLNRRRAFRLAIVRSRQRTGELDPTADPEQLA